jgi:hypothetical protein
MTLKEIRSQIVSNRNAIRRFGVQKIGFFGSFVRGEQKDDSDIDLLVIFEPGKKSIDNLMDLYEFVQQLFHRKIDLLTPEGISPYLRPYIEKETVYEIL